MKKSLFVVKIGGSVLTDKSNIKSAFRKNITRQLIAQIVEAQKKAKFDLILVHGAGAYPHYLTTKYRLDKGFIGRESAKGFVIVKNELFKLNDFFRNECLKQGLTVCTVQPSAVIVTNLGKIKKFHIDFIQSLLKMGIVPLLMGDDVIDEAKGIAVLSGDQIITYLSRKFEAERIIFVSDVEGVFDKNPKVYKDAEFIKEINSKNFKSIIDSMKVFNKNDASCEMKGKILAIADDLAEFDVRIVSGLLKNSVRDALLGKNKGTVINL